MRGHPLFLAGGETEEETDYHRLHRLEDSTDKKRGKEEEEEEEEEKKEQQSATGLRRGHR